MSSCILKCIQDFFLLKYGKMTYTESTALKGVNCLPLLRGGAFPPHGATWGKPQGLAGGGGE